MTIPARIIEKARRNYMRNPQLWEQAHGYWFTSIVSKGQLYFVMVGWQDIGRVDHYRWYYKDGYAVTSLAGKRIKMHHLIAGKPDKGLVTDHINRDRMDNRRENLRHVPVNVNAKNMTAQGYRKHGRGWEAAVFGDGVYKYLGTFPTEIAAQNAYQTAKAQYL